MALAAADMALAAAASTVLVTAGTAPRLRPRTMVRRRALATR